MGNCLVTKLKSVVDNPLLPKLDEIVLHVSPRSPYSERIAILQLATFGSRSYGIEIIGDGVFVNTNFSDLSDPSKTMTSGTFQGTNSDQSYWFSNGDYYVKIKGKGLTRFRIQKYGSYIEETIFDIEISDVIGYAELKTLTFCRTNIYGDIKSLGNNKSLTTLDIRDSIISGEISVLAERQVAAGRTSGTLEVSCNAYVTLNGTIVGNGTTKTISFNSSGYTVS